MIKGQDVLVLLKAALLPAGQPWRFAQVASSVGMSASEVHGAATRLAAARLLVSFRPNRPAVREFLVHAVKYAFVPERGRVTRGVPTAYAVPPLAALVAAGDGPPPVWPDPDGPVRGESFAPIYKVGGRGGAERRPTLRSPDSP